MSRTPRIPKELTKAPFSLQDALAAGLTKSSLKGRSWRRIGTEIYCWTGVQMDPLSILIAWRSRLPPDAFFTGFTAAWLRRLDVDPCNPIEVVARGVRSRPGLIVRHFETEEVTEVRGLRATTLARTFRDLRRRLATVELLVLADQALRLGLGRFHELAAPAESPMETRLRWLLVSSKLPKPDVQTDLYDDAGIFLGRADLFYRFANLVIEFDGGSHRERLVSDVRFTAADLQHRAAAIVVQVRAAIGS